MAAAQAQVDITQRRRKKPSLAKDIAIGVALAAVVLGVFAVVKFVVLDKKSSRAAPAAAAASLEVRVADQGSADVFVDGEKRGAATGGKLAVADLAPGSHQVRVVRDGTTGCEATVDLSAGQAQPFDCALQPVPAVDAAPEPAADGDGGAEVAAGDGDGGVEVAAQEVDAGADAGVTADAGTSAAATGPAVPVDAGAQVATQDRPPPTPGPGSGHVTGHDTGHVSKPITIRPPPGDKIDLGGSRPVPDKTKPDKGTADKPDKGTADKPDKGTADKPATEAVGYLTAYATPWAQVAIDGKPTGKMTPITPQGKIPLPPGVHKITFTVGREKFTYSVKIEAGKTSKITKDLPVTGEPTE